MTNVEKEVIVKFLEFEIKVLTKIVRTRVTATDTECALEYLEQVLDTIKKDNYALWSVQ